VARGARGDRPLPSKDEILRYVAERDGALHKRDLARAFGLKADQRVALKQMLRELIAEGAIEKGRGRRVALAARLPAVAVIEVVDVDVDGDVFAKPATSPPGREPPRIHVLPGKRAGAALGVGDRVLAKLTPVGPDLYQAEPIRELGTAPDQVIGIFERVGREARIVPTDRKIKTEFHVDAADAAQAEPGELVLGEVEAGRRLGLPRARIVERIGKFGDPRSYSLIAIHTHGIRTAYPPAAVAEATAIALPGVDGREDLRTVPLVTIDPSDARDHDDAVWAEPDDDPANPGGFHVIVAIADVAYFVRPGSAIDLEARARGNSTYFPDRMVPMLPEALAADKCSLKPALDRPCLAVHLWYDAGGDKRRHRFVRGLMRSAAKLSYEQVQAAYEGRPEPEIAPLLELAIRPLYRAFIAVDAARERRAPLEIDLPERRVVLGPDGHIASVAPRPRLASHRLIEEFMIAANIAAAETLEAHKAPCMYRIHDVPAPDKLEALREVIEPLGYKLARAQVLKPQHFNQILAKAAGTPHERLVNEIVLRSQAQAQYNPANLGHFGLALRRYAHFTSPIRRYADLLVHRALIGALGLGPGSLAPAEAQRFTEIGAEISGLERQSEAAERDATNRYVAAFMAERVGATFPAHISGATHFGLFVALDATGAEGLVPMRSLGDDFFIHVPERHALVGRRSKRAFTVGDAIAVALEEVNLATGSLRFALVGEDRPPAGRAHARPRPYRGKRR